MNFIKRVIEFGQGEDKTNMAMKNILSNCLVGYKIRFEQNYFYQNEFYRNELRQNALSRLEFRQNDFRQ